MSDRDTTPEEIEAGAAALRELAATTPLPVDVLARLEGRLASEPGLAAPHRPARRRHRPRRAAFLVPGFGVALAAVVAIAVIVTQGSSPAPTAAPTAGAFQKRSAAVVPQTPAATGRHATDSATAAPLRAPSLVGRSYPAARALATGRGLRLLPAHDPCTPPATTHVTRQTPRAGAPIAAGAAITVHTQRCGS